VTDPPPTGVLHRGSRVPDRPAASVVVLVLDRVDLLDGCLSTLAGSSSVPTEVVVVANGTDPAALAALRRRDDVVLVRSGVNLGFGGGCDLGAEVARGEFLVFVNDDSRLDAGCIDRLVARARTDPTIGAVGSRIYAGDGRLQEAGGIFWRDGSSAHVGRDRPAAERAYVVARDVDYCSANGLLVRRSAWDAVGGFDDAYFPAYYEDADLCMALRDHGLRTVYEPTATLVHLETQSSTPEYRRFLMDRNRATFRRRWADALAAHPDPPATDRRGAIDRRVEEGRTLPALVDATDGVPLEDGAAGTAGGADDVAVASFLEHRERRATADALEVKDAYIATLSVELRASRRREEHATRFRRRARAVGLRVRSLVPAPVKATVRSLLGHR
jgi:O-antigen biosynthesis protein